jgi:hypothetical protein
MKGQHAVDATGMRGFPIAHNGNERSCLTLIPWVTPGGEEGPPVLVMSRSTYRGEATMRAVFTKKISAGNVIVPLRNIFLGLVEQLLQKAGPHRAGTHVKATVIWDICASHRSDEPKAKPAEPGIDLKFIPAGETGALQPLVLAIFGERKARAVAESGKLGNTQMKAMDALRRFLAGIALAWNAILPQ